MTTASESPVRAMEGKSIEIQSSRRLLNCGTGAHSAKVSPKHARYRGIGMVWTAIFLLLILLLMGLSLDTGRVALSYSQLHNAADAGALAGAPFVKKDQNDARRRAQMVAAQNMADGIPVLLDLNLSNDAAGDIIIGKYTYTAELGFHFIRYDPSSPDPLPVNALAVIARRDTAHGGSLPLNFGSLADVNSVDLTGNWQDKHGPYAIAITGGGTGAGLICLRPDGTGMHVQGDSRVVVINMTDNYEEGAIQINSGVDYECLTGNGGPELVADIVNLHALEWTEVGNFELSDQVEQIWRGEPMMPDPLAWLNKPPYKPTLNPGTNYGTVDIQNSNDIPDDPVPAGWYPGGITLKGGTADDPIRLGSGVFVLDGAGFQVLANSYVVCDPAGVFFYITGEGSLYISGNAYINAAPLTEGPYAGIIMAQDNEDLNDAEITGTGDSIIEGTLYFPQHRPADEQKKGNGEGFALRLGGTGLGTGNQIIADSLYIFGTGDKIINYDGRNPAPVGQAYLVE